MYKLSALNIQYYNWAYLLHYNDFLIAAQVILCVLRARAYVSNEVVPKWLGNKV